MERENMFAARLAITIMVDKRARALPGANQRAIEQLCALVETAIVERVGDSSRLARLCLEAAKLSSRLPETTENYFVESLLECIPEAERLYEEMRAPGEKERRDPREGISNEAAAATRGARRNEETSRQSTSEPDVSCPRTTVPAGRRPRARAPGGLRFALRRMAENGDTYAAQAIAFSRRREGRCCQIEISKSHRASFIENMERYGITENQLNTDGTESQGLFYTRNKGRPHLFALSGGLSMFQVRQLVRQEQPDFACSSCHTGGRGCHYCVPKYFCLYNTHIMRNSEDVEGATALNALRGTSSTQRGQRQPHSRVSWATDESHTRVLDEIIREEGGVLSARPRRVVARMTERGYSWISLVHIKNRLARLRRDRRECLHM